MNEQQTPDSPPDPLRHIGIVLFEGVEELDAVGPWDVLAAWTQHHPEDGWAVTTLSRDGGEVVCAKGLGLRAAHSFADAPALDVLLHPGGRGTRPPSCRTPPTSTGSGPSAGPSR